MENLGKFYGRNFEKLEEKEEMYLGNKIVAWKYKWEEYNEKKDEWEKKQQVYCYLYRAGSKWQPLNLGECNDGGKFTAVNQAKDFVNCCNENGW